MREMRLALMSFLLLLSIGQKAVGQNVLATWPVGVPLCYLSFLDDGTYRIDTTGIEQPYRHCFTPSLMMDSSNDVLFQCNGHVVANKAGQFIDGGEHLTDDLFYAPYYRTGNTITQSTVALPKRNNTYWLFYYSFSDSLFDSGEGSPDRLYYAIVDMNANNGAGRVTQKKVPVYKGVMGDCRLTAVRHGNGHDWWLVNHGYLNDVYNKFLVTDDTITGPFEQHIGPIDAEPDLYGMAQFNPDGSRYASGNISSPLNIMDFDRCTGLFSNSKLINVYSELPWQPATDNSIVDGVCFSPNSRFLYVTTLKYLLQYDLWANSIDSSRTLIAKIDSSYRNESPFFTMFVTPHNKILISNYQGLPGYCNYQTIESPDSVGWACNFQKESLFIPSSGSNYTLPNIVNLKLGALNGSACDTITTSTNSASVVDSKSQIRVFPNPASNLIFIKTKDLTTAGSLSVTDALGRVKYTNQTFDGASVIKVNDWQTGIYFWSISNANGKATYGKFLVQH